MTKNELDKVRKGYDMAKEQSSPTQNNITKEVSSMRNNDDDQDDVTVEYKARSEFDSSVAIRAEFSNVDRYVAFCKAEARGKTKILGGMVRGGK